MKIISSVCLLLSFGVAGLPQVVHASGVNEASVPADIEWFVHVDADLLRVTESGATLIREFQKLSPAQDNPDMPIDPVLIVNGLRGLTAFGSLPDLGGDAESVDAVFILDGTPELIQVFKGFIAGLRLEQPEALIEMQIGEQTILQMNGEEISGIFLDGNRIAIGKSLASLVDFLEVYRGNQAHVSLGTRFPTYRLGMDTGIFMGAFVEGMDGFQHLPAQARILQLTEAVSVQLGESADYLQLLASLSTDSVQTAKQVQEVLQGIVALMMITQTGQQDFAELINSTRISVEGSAVTMSLSYPVDSAKVWIGRLAELAKASMEARQEEGPVEDSNSDEPVEEPADSPPEQ